jgi:DNA-binding MarR family transcriptional regulator
MPDGIPIRHYEVLQSLADLGPHSQHDLSELLWVNRTIMVKLIDSLESEGLVERRRNPADRRSYALELTAAGEHARAQLAAAADRAEERLTAPLSEREVQALRAFLASIAATELPEGLAKRISFLLSPAHHRLRERVAARLDALSLTTAQYGTLGTLVANGPVSQQVLASELGLTGPAVMQTVDRLEALGFVERRRDPNDRRSYALTLTAHGLATARRAREAIAEIMEELDGILGGPDQRRELNRLLRKLLGS